MESKGEANGFGGSKSAYKGVGGRYKYHYLIIGVAGRGGVVGVVKKGASQEGVVVVQKGVVAAIDVPSGPGAELPAH